MGVPAPMRHVNARYEVCKNNVRHGRFQYVCKDFFRHSVKLRSLLPPKVGTKPLGTMCLGTLKVEGTPFHCMALHWSDIHQSSTAHKP